MFRFSFSGTRNIIFGTLKIGQNDPEIPNLEFESHGFLQNHVFLPTEQAETNICWIIYQDATFKICLSLFGWKVNILDKMHIVQCTVYIINKAATLYLSNISSFLLKIGTFEWIVVTSFSFLWLLPRCWANAALKENVFSQSEQNRSPEVKIFK